jgi:DNA repair exonuclease SbcCD nuclease subunit
VRFVHTADWQLGMTRHFLDEDAQPRYTDARLAAIRAIGRLARAENAEFVLVTGDVFESNQLSTRTLVRSLDAMRDADVPIYLLPGNHDPLDAGSIYRREAFTSRCPPNTHVLDRAGRHPLDTTTGTVELLAAPWFSKRPLSDLVAAVCQIEPPADGVVRIVAGHGCVDTLSPDPHDPARIDTAALRAAIDAGLVHYVALGDRHSLTDVGIAGRAWYSGTPEVTDYDEVEPGFALVVDVDASHCEVTPRRIGGWRFERHKVALNDSTDVRALRERLAAWQDRERTVLELILVGALSLRERAELDDVLREYRHLFAALEIWDRHTDLVTMPDDEDIDALELTGFAAATLRELSELASADAPEARTATDALRLLHRLARSER